MIDKILKKAIEGLKITIEEGIYLSKNAPTSLLMFTANEIRKQKKKSNIVTWIIDRNANTTNVCIANCKFCNFYRIPNHKEAYITTIEEYKKKINETFKFGGEQLLLQGGHHPELGIEFYENLFKELKFLYPKLKLHALGPPEIDHISKLSKLTYKETLSRLKKAGLDSLPGAGAEILNDRVRHFISNGKCNSQEWLDVMREAHKLNLTTSATMMFGHIETIEERFEHLEKIRQVQDEKPKDSKGFLAFIPWTFQDENTTLKRVKKVINNVNDEEYIRMIAISRIFLINIENIQASWLTVGKEVAQICLHSGANDFGSIMIEENVVSAAGAPHRFSAKTIQEAIREAGFIPQLRNQEYEFRELPREAEMYEVSY